MAILSEFKEFIREYKIVPLAIAFIMGIAATTLIKSLVDNIIMPLITPFIPGGAWQTAIFSIGPVAIAWVVFLVAKLVLREEKVSRK